MTGINRNVIRQSTHAIHSAGRRRPIVIELHPPGDVIGFRLKGTRTTYCLPVDWCYREALRNELARRKAERRKARLTNKQH
jgi:hypothetical protein